MTLYLGIFSIVLFVSSIKGQVFVSVSKMSAMASLERNLTENLRHYVNMCNSKSIDVPENVVSFLNHMEGIKGNIYDPHYMENPINAFHFAQRMYKRWTEVDETITGDLCPLEDPCHVYEVRKNRIHRSVKEQVTANDLRQAGKALIRLWRTYKLDLGDLYKGKIWSTQTDPLTVNDVLFITNLFEEDKHYQSEIDWLQPLVNMYAKCGDSEESYQAFRKASQALASAYYKVGKPMMSKEIIDHVLEKDPDRPSLKRDLAFYAERCQENRQEVYHEEKPDPNIEKYELLCRGKGTRSKKILSKLRCIYRKTLVPFYVVKEEIYNFRPRVSVFYEVITPLEMDELKEIGRQHLKPSMVVGDGDQVSDFKYRVSETAWFHDDTWPLAKKLSRRVQLVTGLSTQQFTKLSHAEEFQVLNYGIGGMYEPHLDYLNNPIDSDPLSKVDPEMCKYSGDRIATWMFYLSDVKAGGGTVFVHLNITVPAVKGSAVFWFNYNRRGKLDENTLHAGCPVLLGSKWVANKWIRQTGQIFRRKCGRTVNSIDVPF